MLIASGQKKTLIPVFKGIDAYDMPKEFRKLAAQDVGKVGAMQDLVRGVEKLIGKKKLEPDIEQGVFIRNASPSIEVLLKRGYMALEDSDWDKASELFDHVLNIEVSNAEAYLGLAMAEFFCRNKDDFRKAYITPGSALKNNKRLARARQFGDEQMSCWIQTLDRDATDKNQERLSIIAKCQHMIVPISGSHSVGLKSDGRVLVTKYTGEREYYCGQCEIRDWTDIVAIAANSVHTVGIKADGTVISTKYIGNPEWYTGECEVSSWTNVKSIALGSFFTMGVKENGKVITTKCIRNDLSTNYGQCDVNEWTNIVFISLGEAHTVGLKANGTVIATGKNDYGQCDVSGWTDIIAIASGRDYTVGLKSDGTVVAVGNNENGQCEVSGWSNVASIASRGFYTVGIKTDGTVVAAGKNTYGQCNVSEWTDIVSVSLGGICTLGLKTDGTVVAAGQNRFGECDVIGWSDIVAIASGGSYSLGIKSNGTVVSTLHNRRHSPYNHYSGECDVGGWKLFDNYETIEAERKAAAKKAEAERKAAAEKAEAELKAKIEALSKERTALQTELPNLRGLFSGKRRREIEARLAEIEAELKKLG